MSANVLSRRLALFSFGRAAAVTAAATATILTPPPATAISAPAVQPEPTGPFRDPADYLAAMQAIGWRVVAGFHWCRDGSIHRMGIYEYGPVGEGRAGVERTWPDFHRIQMRCPVMTVDDDGHPRQEWWKAVWQHLYDAGLREDVTSKAGEWDADT